MTHRINRQVRLKSRPVGIPQAEHFEIVSVPISDLGDNEVLVRNIYLACTEIADLRVVHRVCYTWHCATIFLRSRNDYHA